VPDVKFDINGERAQTWLLNTYVDADTRITRGDGGAVIVFVKVIEETVAEVVVEDERTASTETAMMT
jgi:hypothetical protein